MDGALSVKCPQHIFEEFASLVGASVSCAIHYLMKTSYVSETADYLYHALLSSYMRRISIQKPFNLVLNCNFGGDFVYRPTEFTMSCNRKMSPTMCQGISKNNVAVFETLVKKYSRSTFSIKVQIPNQHYLCNGISVPLPNLNSC